MARLFQSTPLQDTFSCNFNILIAGVPRAMPKPMIRLGTTSASSSVSRMMRMALSMSSRMRPRPLRRCSFSSLRLQMK